ncbi:MAG: hypothetical protein AAF481_01380 [Acidobacteriota bacterium]
MRKLFSMLMTCGLALAVLAVGSMATAQDEQVDDPTCEVLFETGEVETKGEAVQIAIALTEPVGAVETIEIDPDSGVTISSMDAEDGLHLRLEADTTAAKGGVWSLWVVGETGTCTGQLSVAETDQA